MRVAMVAVLCLAAALSLRAQGAGKTLDIYYIDTEGGQSTLFVAPTGESLLVDAGNADDRDLGRILETLKTAGVTRIDHVWITHYHGDHVGSLLALARQVPVGHFYDHGQPHPGDRIVSAAVLTAYEQLSAGKRTIVTPGMALRLGGVAVTAVASANQFVRTNLPGAGRANGFCAGVARKDESGYIDPDNGESAGFLMQYGRFRTVDLGDLTWNGELDLMCPTNRLGEVDVYLTSHHGLDRSGAPALVHALRPRVVVMNNGPRKGGAPDTFRVLHAAPGLEDLWQLHWSYAAQLDNAPAVFIANIDDGATVASVLTAPPPAPRAGGPGAATTPGAPPVAATSVTTPPATPAARGPAPGAAAAAHTPAYLIRISASADGSFVVTNTRNGFTKTYARRPSPLLEYEAHGARFELLSERATRTSLRCVGDRSGHRIPLGTDVHRIGSRPARLFGNEEGCRGHERDHGTGH